MAKGMALSMRISLRLSVAYSLDSMPSSGMFTELRIADVFIDIGIDELDRFGQKMQVFAACYAPSS